MNPSGSDSVRLLGSGLYFYKEQKGWGLAYRNQATALGDLRVRGPRTKKKVITLPKIWTDSLSESLNSGRFNEDEDFTQKLPPSAGTPWSSSRKQVRTISIVGQDLAVLMDLELTIREKLIGWKHRGRIFEPELKLTNCCSILDIWFNKHCRLRPTSLGLVFDGSSSRLKDTLRLNQPYRWKLSDETPMLLTQAEAMLVHKI
ncbi:hypothetical protein F3Y22_tig00110372pilonHSYRG00111 [Hibiscus syriacus]|uniref:Uncharacterized protein n=1 Tax=Hibiscus syriacus TaxID=106335 RepID=A0A6A3AXS8_HIBSY|nr:hypothetical protein F3Y22_tig00110372pilonHSYRG00111 [Hibiscus syriacus]